MLVMMISIVSGTFSRHSSSQKLYAQSHKGPVGCERGLIVLLVLILYSLIPAVDIKRGEDDNFPKEVGVLAHL